MRMRTDEARTTEPITTHSNGVIKVHERLLGASAAGDRYVDTGSGRRVHVIEAGEGPPFLLLHGSSTSSLSYLPLLERAEGIRVIAVDRPGFGLSDAVPVPRRHFREAAVRFVDEVLDVLGLESIAVGGSSMGGTWALWYALARPERVRRLVLLGSAPLLPGTRLPAAVRLMAAPLLGDLAAHVVKPNAQMVVRLLSSMGEKHTVVKYPQIVEAIVAAGRDPVAARANLAELRAISTPVGFRRSMKVRAGELRSLRAPALLVWGDHDPVGTPRVAHEAAALLPEAQLEVLPAGHVPWFGNPDRVYDLMASFVRAGVDG